MLWLNEWVRRDDQTLPFPEGNGRTKPGRRKGAPVVSPAGLSSVTPYVVRQVTRLTRSFSASFDSSSLACSSLRNKAQGELSTSTHVQPLKCGCKKTHRCSSVSWYFNSAGVSADFLLHFNVLPFFFFIEEKKYKI